MTRASTGLVSQNTSCKAHKVCRFASTVLWYNFVLSSEHIEKRLYTDID